MKNPRNVRCDDGRDCEICNHDEGNQHPKDQEDLTRKSPRNIWRLWRQSEKDEGPWKQISFGDVSTCIQGVDAYNEMSLENVIIKKVICDLFLVSDLLEKVWVCM